jgi:hypothetical protein
MIPSIQSLIDQGDLAALLRVLRRHPDTRSRTQVAEHLGEVDEPDVIEALIRAVLDDPELEVRLASRTSLHRLLGRVEAEQALKAYGVLGLSKSYEEPYPSSTDNELYDQPVASNQWFTGENSDEFLQFSPSSNRPQWDEEQIGSLISILDDDSHPDRQLKALQIMADNPTTAGLDAIARAALWSDNKEVKVTSQAILREMYGENLSTFLDQYRLGFDDSLESDQEPPGLIAAHHSSQHVPVDQNLVQAEGLNNRWLGFIMLLLIIIFFLIIYWFFLR